MKRPVAVTLQQVYSSDMANKPTFNAVIRQLVAGAYNGKQYTIKGRSSAASASNEAYRHLQPIAFGGYRGDLEIEIAKEGAASIRTVSIWYVRFRADGSFRCSGAVPLGDGKSASARLEAAFPSQEVARG